MKKFGNKEFSVAGFADEEVFQKYVEDLKLSPEDFEKTILDIGSGSGQFSKWARDHGVSSHIYNLDKQVFSDRKNMVVGKAESLPFADNSFDLVVSDAAIPHGYIDEGSREDAERKVVASLKEAARVLKHGGEIRFARVLMGEIYENQKILTQSVQKALEALRVDGLEVMSERTPSNDTYEYEGREKRRLLAKAYLITIKKI